MNAQDDQEGIWFSYYVTGEEFIAFISNDSLMSMYRCKELQTPQLLATFHQHEKHITTLAEYKFIHNAPRPIRITMEDFAKIKSRSIYQVHPDLKAVS